MILFYSDGRLGNQIFQLAFLREISKTKGMAVVFNFKKVLSAFDIDFKVYNIELENKIWNFFFRKVFFYIFEFLSFLRIISIICEDTDLVKYKEKRGLFWFITYVRTGFFQSDKFFNDKSFLDNIKIKDSYIDCAKEFIKTIPDSFTKIFIHIRRGDYLTAVYNGRVGINLPLNYYIKAIDLVNKKVENPYYIILSDDIEFAEIAFKNLKNKTFSRNNFIVDLAIMSLCDGGVISNSSYSWWGAFLLKDRKIVVMPKYWLGWKEKIQSHKGVDLSFAEVIDF